MTGQKPIFPILGISPNALHTLRLTKLTVFHKTNVDAFTKLIVVCYEWFLSEEKMRQQQCSGRPQGEALFKLFCTLVKKTLTAAESSVIANMGKYNRLADAFLYNHLRAEGIGTWQDYENSDEKDPMIEGLIRNFIHFIAAKGFENGAAVQASCPTAVMRARGFIHNINRGDPRVKLTPV